MHETMRPHASIKSAGEPPLPGVLSILSQPSTHVQVLPCQVVKCRQHRNWQEQERVTVSLSLPDRYLLLEFPVLTVQDPPQRIAELGCGCGSALLPILKVHPEGRSYCCVMLRLRTPLSACCECRILNSRQSQVCKVPFTQGASDMQENRQSTVMATDISPTAVRLFEAAAARAGIASHRIQAFACDSADPATGDAMLSGALQMPPAV